MHGYVLESEPLLLVLELMELGNLRDYLRKVSGEWEGLQHG
jgi:hypothetical protein